MVDSCWYVQVCGDGFAPGRGPVLEEGADIGIVIALSLTITNTLAFSRCDKFGHASNIAGGALYSGGIAGNVASGMIGRFFNRG